MDLNDKKELDHIASELEKQNKDLHKIIESVSNFLNVYSDIRDNVGQLKGVEDFDLGKSVKNINAILDETSTSINSYVKEFETIKDDTANMNENINTLKAGLENTNKIVSELNIKLADILKSQEETDVVLQKLEEYLNNIRNINFSSLDENLNKYSEKIEKLDRYINEEITEKIEKNVQNIDEVNKNVNALLEKMDNVSLADVLNEIKKMNAVMGAAQKEKFALTQEVEVILNSWADRNGIKRK